MAASGLLEPILVTGGTGMVGQNLREHPALSGARLLMPGRAELDLRDAAAVRAYMQLHRPATVIHAAGKVGGIQANMRDPAGFLIENLDLGRNVITAAVEAGASVVLNLASSCIYPRDRTTLLREEDLLTGPLEPTNEGYALAKIAVLKLAAYLDAASEATSLKSVIPCNLFGLHDNFKPASSHLLPAIIQKVHGAIQTGVESVEIWGDGTARREFLFATDFADAVVHCLQNFDAMPDLMNIGLGFDYSINEYYQTVADVLGYSGGFHHDLDRPVGMARKVVDVSRLDAMGWKPRHDLKQAVGLTYEFFLRSAV